jgi:hypothetical protein
MSEAGHARSATMASELNDPSRRGNQLSLGLSRRTSDSPSTALKPARHIIVGPSRSNRSAETREMIATLPTAANRTHRSFSRRVRTPMNQLGRQRWRKRTP